MSLLESLPPRPLSPKELTGLNTADAFELAVSVESDGDARSLLLATDAWVKGLAFDEQSEAWTVVETVSLDDRPRIEGLQVCEEAVWAFRDETDAEGADADDTVGADEADTDAEVATDDDADSA
ncbi:hypothetical protein [Halopelagius longus]|uniref:DUF7964 domain-containing protein n=1 Tax=Halopelagius longus TaxID=1236180 RepID=A0A1H1ARL1_9EURY|nr:hypothetical protein [Halopelagius longus]SDQ42365.1 hypothetical protein SAMN05216278_1462 [Halopelagius longus]